MINPYHVHVRRKSPASAHLVKMSLQLYQVKADPYAHPFKPVTIMIDGLQSVVNILQELNS